MSRFDAFFAEMTVPASGIGILAGSRIEFVANVGFCPTLAGSSWLLPRWFAGATFDPIGHDNGGIKSAEPVEVSEEGVLARSNFVAQGSVVEDELVMRGREFSCKL